MNKIKYVDSLILMASMYDEYLYLDIAFVKEHKCLFGVKSELYNTVKANKDAYEGAYLLYRALYKRFHKEIIRLNFSTKVETELLDWGELLYGETRYDSDKERKDYGIKEFKPKWYRRQSLQYKGISM